MIKALKVLMLAFMLIVIASCAAPALAQENFGLGADVEIEVERALQDQFVIEADTYSPFYILISLILAFVVVLLLVKFKTRILTAIQGGEKLG